MPVSRCDRKLGNSQIPPQVDFCSAFGVRFPARGLDDVLTHLGSEVASVSLRHPEETRLLGLAFRDTTNSYKLVWFLALLSLMKRHGERAFRLDDVVGEMAVVAWHPVCFYRLSLGRQDRLQDIVKEIQHGSGLQPSATRDEVRHFVESSDTAKQQLNEMKRYVPKRFLAPWFADELRGRRDTERNRLIVALAKKSQSCAIASPYWLDADCLTFNDSWRAFLVDNLAVVHAFVQHHFTQYLQARNPSVPGVVNKLRVPLTRDLQAAKHFWHLVRDALIGSGHRERFHDIYSDAPLAESFSIDHFLPWSFVAHNQLWNLAPVAKATNSSKGDSLPDLGLYLPRLSTLHYRALQAAKSRPKLLEDHINFFRKDVTGLLKLSELELLAGYKQVMEPQGQIAANLGFQAGWRLQR